MENLTSAIKKTFDSVKHINGYKWAKQNNVHAKDHGSLNDADYDKMEGAVNDGAIDMDIFNAINNGDYKLMVKYDK